MTDRSSIHEAPPRPPAIVRAAPAAAIALWGTLAVVAFTLPIQPYAEGTWRGPSLPLLVATGVLAGLAGGGMAGLAGAMAGFGAAVAIQLLGLHGQARVNDQVRASLSEPPWSADVTGALAVGLAAILVGAVAAVIVKRLLLAGRPGARRPGPGWPLRVAALVGVGATVGVGVWALVQALAGTPYVVGGDRAAPAPPLLWLGAVAGILVAGGSAAGSVLAARRGRRGRGPTAALVAGVVAGGLATLLLGFFIDLAANPF